MSLLSAAQRHKSKISDISRVVLPPNWKANFDSVDLPVRCGEDLHIVKWTPDEIVPLRHTRSEITLTALGGKLCPCLMIANAWMTGKLDNNLEVKDIVECLSVDDLEIFFERLNCLEATHRIMESVFGSWMLHYGAEIHLHKEVQTWSEEPSSFVPVGGFAAWGSGAKSRAAILVSDQWYNDVSSHKPYIQGRFYLGHNGRGHILLEPTILQRSKGVVIATARYVETIEEAELLSPVDPVPFRRYSRKGNVSDSAEYVGFTKNYNETLAKSSQIRTSRVLLDEKLYSQKDAATWSLRENVWQTFVVDPLKNNLDDFKGNVGKSFGWQDELRKIEKKEVLEECAKRNISLHEVSLNYTSATRRQVGWTKTQ